MRTGAVLVAVVVLLSGCIGAGGPEVDQTDHDDRDEDPSAQQTQPRSTERLIVYEDSITASAEGGDLDIGGSTILGAGLDTMSLELGWEQPTNAFTASAESPSGEVFTIEDGSPLSTEASGEIDDARPGLWRFSVSSDGPHVPDDVRLEITATWTMLVDAGVLDAAETNATIQTEQRGDAWYAWQEHRRNDTVGSAVNAIADTTNGAINLSTGGPSTDTNLADPLVDRGQEQDGHDRAYVQVEAWARADSEEQARERVTEIDVSITIEDDLVEVDTQAPDWDNRGANVDILLPSDIQVTPRLDTTNGPITVLASDVRDAELETTNGPVQADLTGSGELLMEATNGPIFLSLTPEAGSQLDLDTTNGPVEVELTEGDRIGYVLEASTTNGQISESMDEAELEGDDDEATLRTQGGQDRPIQVQGAVDSTNGNIAFRSG